VERVPKTASELISEYLAKRGVDDDRRVREAAADRHYVAYLLTGEVVLRDAAIAIWKEVGSPEDIMIAEITNIMRWIS